MAEKWQTISELAETTSRQVTQSPEQWRRFLTTAGRFYKAYDFDDQLLIYAQKPDATACADMPTWNNKMRRWVNGGSTAIALVRKGYGGKPYLDYVHDVADTHPVRGGKDPWLWSMDDDSRMPVMERLREVFGAEGGNDLGDLLMDAAAKSVEDTYGDYLTDLIYEKEDSFLEELDDLNIEVTFRDTLRASVQYAVLTRCGLDASRYLDEEDLRGITNFNTIATLACLGTATAQVNRTILLEIGDTIRNIEREKVKKPLAKQEAVAYNDGRNFNTLKRERGDKDGIDIQQTERLSGAEPENGRNGRESADPGPVRESQREISDGTQERAVQYDGAQRQTMEAPDGDRQGGAGTGGRADGGDGKEPGRERSPESGQSNGLGAENEHHLGGGGVFGAELPYLPLKTLEETAGVKPAVSSSAELEEPFSTQPAYRQMTLFDLPEVQIEKIAQKEAEAAAPASSRSRQKKKEQPQGNPLEAARRNLFAESGKEDNQLSLDLAAMTGRESASGPDIQEAEPVPPRTLKEIYAEYQPVVLSRVLNDEAYQNALKNSDPENIRIEGDAAVKRAVLAVNEPELLRLYYDFPEFHTRLHKEVLEKAGAALTVSQPEAAGGGPLEAQKEGAQGKLPPQAVPVVESAGAGGSDSLKPSANVSAVPARDPLAPAYQVGDSVYLEDTLFQVTGLKPDYVELLDPALAYPIFRSERIENFERLLRQDSRNGAITEFLAPAVNSIDADLREVLTGDGGLLEQRDKELLAECFRAGDGNTRIAQRLSDTYAGTAETMELVTGETADYFASTTSLEINIFDKYDTKRTYSWADLAPVLRSLYQAEQNGFFHEPVIQEPVTLQGPPSYQVGDSVHLPLPGRNIAGTIGYVGELDVRIDTGPYSWSHETISRPQFEEALRHDERNAALFPHVPDLTGQSITRKGDSLTIGNGPATHEIDITVTDEEWRQIKEAIPDQAEMQPEQAPAAENFHITDPDLGAGGQKTKFQNNVAAIRLLKDLESQGRLAAPEEQEVLARYVGWGGLPQAFDEANEKWAAEYAELKELLTPEEYASARGSTLNAHYTSPTVIQSIYEAVGRMGIQPETVLEPAMGVGNFFGLLPETMQGATLLGVELDSITGRLAGQLYPQAKILVDGFEHTNLPDNSIDLAVGNVPFGNYKLPDPRYDSKNLLIHDYFFAKTLDKVRPGGIVAFISSKGTLDKQDSTVREYLAQKADLLGAVRLPNNAFAKNAGTEVTSDILFLQKRESPPEQLPEWVHLGQTADGIPINRYFEQHPEMVLGTMAWDKSMYGNEKETTCEPVPGAALEEQLAAAIENLSQPDQRLLQEKTEVTVDELLESLEAPDPMARNFSYTEIGGKLYFLENGDKTAVDLPAATAQRIRGMIGLREITRNLIDLQLYDGTDEEIKQAQAKLNTAYDAFTAKFGLLNSTGNKRAFEQDSAYCLLCSLEILDEDGNLERKADMFTKRTINQQVSIDHVDTASEALAVSIGERACVDLGFMSTLLGRPGDVEPIIEDLKGVIFKNPEAGSNPYAGWETADEYLSGNVRKKLTAARVAAERDPAFADNVAALEQAQPKDLSAAEIDVRIGVTWIDTRYYTQFVHELLKTPGYLHEQVQARYSPATGEWNVSGKSRDSVNNSLAYVTYGTKRRNAYAIIEDSLNLRDTRIYDTIHDPDGSDKRVLNVKETMLAQQKQEQIREAFKSWIWKDPERRADLCRKYNELYNAIRPRSYNGDHIRFSGMNPEISLRPHQRNAVARMLYGGNSLLAHCVGAGKTFEIVAAAIESKRLGLTKKSLVVVPNHLTEQWGADFLRLYPGANVLVATKKDFEPANRKKFCSRIATGDYDAVVIGHSQFEKIPLSPERQKSILQEQIDQVIDGIQEAKAQDGERYTIKQLEKSRKSLEARMAKLNDQSRKDDVITFEELGVDKLYVDEAHGFKNLFLATKMRNVAGIGQSEAQKSSDMFAKCRYLDEITGGRGVVFATGTPVSNSMVELYTMMRYLQYDMLKESGLEHFDSWAANFGETITALEMAPEGTGFRSKTRFAKFFNLPELMSMWREAADIQTAEMLKLPVPEADKITVVTKPSDFQRAMVEDLGERADLVRTRQVEPRQDNMLKITSDGRKLALDQRLADPSLPDDPESKINSCVKNVLQVWRDTAEIKGTQLVFCDLSTPKNDGSFNAYDDIKQKLMAQGVPPEEIAYIHDAKTETQKAELFAKVRKGQVRVLLGSTAKMGAGTNVQTRLAALHHLDCPWRPADIEQREGRILRQGNLNEVVKIFKYVTENTFDAYNWSILENKQKFIGQLMSGKNPSRSCEDVDEAALSYAEVKALASGDPRIIEMTDLDSQVTKLKLLKANHEGQRYMLEDRLIQFFPQAIKRRQEQIKGLEEDIAHLQAHPQDKDHFSISLAGELYTERKAAGQAIIEACTQMKNVSERIDLGEYRGFPLTLWADTQTQKFQVTMKHSLSHTIELGSDPVGNMARLDHALNIMVENLEENRANLENLTAQMEEAKIEVQRSFPQEQELAEKSDRLNVLRIALNMDGKTVGKRQREAEELESDTQGGQPSIKGMLKRLGVESAATASPPAKGKDMEVAI